MIRALQAKRYQHAIPILAALLGLAAFVTISSGTGVSESLAQSAPTELTRRPEPVARLHVELGSHSAPIRRLAADPSRAILVTASDDKTARVWDLKSGALRTVLRPPIGAGDEGRMYGAALHPTEPIVALGGVTLDKDRRHWIYLFDINTGRLKQAFDAEAGRIRRLVWSTDGSVLIAAYTGLNGLRAFSPTGQGVFRQEFGGAVYGLSVIGERLAATDLDGVVRVYKVGGGKIALEREVSVGKFGPVSVGLSPDGARFVRYQVGTVARNAGAAQVSRWQCDDGDMVARRTVAVRWRHRLSGQLADTGICL
jgi:WD40 repeat protein